MTNKAWSFRALVPGDVPFVMDNWLTSFRDSKWAGCVPNNLYREVQTACINDLLKRGMKVTLAHDADDPDNLIGFLAHEVRPSGEYVVHYCYVKPYIRGHGVAPDLMKYIGCPEHFVYTHRTRSAPPGNGRWVPEIARRLKL
jgi:hypothetical protein